MKIFDFISCNWIDEWMSVYISQLLIGL